MNIIPESVPDATLFTDYDEMPAAETNQRLSRIFQSLSIQTEQKAITRREVYEISRRKGYKSIGLSTMEELGEKRLGLKLRYLNCMIYASGVEAGMCRVFQNVHIVHILEEQQVLILTDAEFLKENLTANQLTALGRIRASDESRVKVYLISRSRNGGKAPKPALIAEVAKELALFLSRKKVQQSAQLVMETPVATAVRHFSKANNTITSVMNFEGETLCKTEEELPVYLSEVSEEKRAEGVSLEILRAEICRQGGVL